MSPLRRGLEAMKRRRALYRRLSNLRRLGD